MTSKQIADWLLSLRGTLSAVPVTVTIDGQSFPGAEYHQERPITPGCRAYDEGKRMSHIHAVYVAGVRPKRVKARGKWDGDSYPSKYYWRREGDTRDWYVAGYCDSVPEGKGEYNPFGPSFLLHPWEVPSGEAIDYYQDVKAGRLPFAVSPV